MRSCLVIFGLALLSFAVPGSLSAEDGTRIELAPGEPLRQQDFDGLMARVLKDEGQDRRVRARLTSHRLPLGNPSTQPVRLEVRSASIDRIGMQFALELDIVEGERSPKPFKLSGDLEELRLVPAPLTDIERGRIVRASDIGLKWLAAKRLPAATLEDMAAIVGQEATTRLQAGKALEPGNLRAPDAISRGDLVTVVFRVPGLEIISTARAVDDGAIGDTVRFTNLQSDRTMRGTVSDARRISVSPGSES